jgi:hypothetical protein
VVCAKVQRYSHLATVLVKPICVISPRTDDFPPGKLPESIHDYAFAYDSEKAVAEFLAKEGL